MKIYHSISQDFCRVRWHHLCIECTNLYSFRLVVTWLQHQKAVSLSLSSSRHSLNLSITSCLTVMFRILNTRTYRQCQTLHHNPLSHSPVFEGFCHIVLIPLVPHSQPSESPVGERCEWNGITPNINVYMYMYIYYRKVQMKLHSHQV